MLDARWMIWMIGNDLLLSSMIEKSFIIFRQSSGVCQYLKGMQEEILPTKTKHNRATVSTFEGYATQILGTQNFCPQTWPQD